MPRTTTAAAALALGLALWSSMSPMALVAAQKVSITDSTALMFVEGSRTVDAADQTAVPTGPYSSYKSKITFTYTEESTSREHTETLTGTYATGLETPSANETETETGTAAKPTNTQPCNQHVEFCKRRYSNITMVGAHNSPFVRPGNSASNQALPVKQQLSDGVRFLQAQMQFPANSSTPHFCHTTCDLLDAGPIIDWLTQVRQWVDKNPYDVVTILLENGNYSSPSVYAPYIEKSGLTKYAYRPPYLPMSLDDWPTLEQMIVRGQRVVMFLDYMADQKKYPWLLDEFSQVWESPFDPTDRAFPCTVQRPPGLSASAAKDRLYLINHNLNAEFNVFGVDLLVPAVSLLNETNAVKGYGSVGLAANTCVADWGRAPNILNVDYYNYGSFPGSVFQAAADLNNVTYNRSSCCGAMTGSDAASSRLALAQAASWGAVAVALFLGFALL